MKYICAILVLALACLTGIAFSQTITLETVSRPQPVIATGKLTPQQAASLLAVVVDPPAGAAYSGIALPAGKTLADFAVITVTATPAGATVIVKFK